MSGPRYVNGAAIAMSQWDLTIEFHFTTPEGVPAPGNTPLVAQRVARIMMSPTHAKVLAQVIGDTVSQWEAAYGALPDFEKLMPSAVAQDAPVDTGAADGSSNDAGSHDE